MSEELKKQTGAGENTEPAAQNDIDVSIFEEDIDFDAAVAGNAAEEESAEPEAVAAEAEEAEEEEVFAADEADEEEEAEVSAPVSDKQRIKEEKQRQKEEAKQAKLKAKAPAPLSKEEEAKRAKQAKKAEIEKKKKAKDKQKKGTFFKKIKDTFMELRNISWPKGMEVLKKLGIVLAVTVIFLLVLIGLDQLMQFLYKLLVEGMAA